MLWIDKHIPKNLDELQCHKFVTELLEKLVEAGKTGIIPHLLFYGPSGGGKKTRIMALIRGIFGSSVDKVTADNFSDKESGTDIMICQSSNHVQLSCPSMGTKDRTIVQGVIKELQSSQKVSAFFKVSQTYRVFVFNDAEVLSHGAQAALRRTVERHARTCRVVLHVNRFSNIIPALRSRCLCIRIPAPSQEEITRSLRKICNSEHISPAQATDSYLLQIADFAGGNLRRAVLLLENAVFSSYPLNLKDLNCFPWENQIQLIANKILTDQSPKTLAECRDIIYDILTVCIPSQVLLETLVKNLLDHPNIPKKLRGSVMNAGAHYSHTMSLGDKAAIHVEAFSANVMANVKQTNL